MFREQISCLFRFNGPDDTSSGRTVELTCSIFPLASAYLRSLALRRVYEMYVQSFILSPL
jgi:hypothetical protein